MKRFRFSDKTLRQPVSKSRSGLERRVDPNPDPDPDPGRSHVGLRCIEMQCTMQCLFKSAQRGGKKVSERGSDPGTILLKLRDELVDQSCEKTTELFDLVLENQGFFLYVLQNCALAQAHDAVYVAPLHRGHPLWLTPCPQQVAALTCRCPDRKLRQQRRTGEIEKVMLEKTCMLFLRYSFFVNECGPPLALHTDAHLVASPLASVTVCRFSCV